jgi:recombination protein RecA
MSKAGLAAQALTLMQSGLGEEARAGLLSARPPYEAISTGSVSVDWGIGPYCRGIPIGRISQIYGTEQAGKSRLACQILTVAQKLGYLTFLEDTENHYTPEWFSRFGGDKNEVLDIETDNLEQSLYAIEQAGKTALKVGPPASLYVFDSLQGRIPKAAQEADGAYDEGRAPVPRILGSRLQRIKDIAKDANMAVLIVGQAREKVDGRRRFGDNNIYTPGGNTLMHLSVLRLFMKKTGNVTEKLGPRVEERVGFMSKIKTIKNNVGGRVPGYAFDVQFADFGPIDDTMALFDIAVGLGVIQHTSNGWYSSDDMPFEKFRGEEHWPAACTPEIRAMVEERIFDPAVVLRQEAERLRDTTHDPEEDE